ncbi:MAG: hypothetical protein JWM07_919 [Candidatus Saccharibacteria bacterium]|nr:hypothetical protein [Candidatus Saccharibacteria bacterium]
MPSTEKILPAPIHEFTLADVEAQVARLRAVTEADQAYAYKNERDNFNNQKLEKVLPYHDERTIGRIAILKAFDTQDTYIPPAF